MALRQLDAVVGNIQCPNNPGEEFYLVGRFKISLLHPVFLRFALVGGLPGIGFLHFFHEVAVAVAMQPGLIAVFAKLSGNIMPVKLETRINEEARKAAANHTNDEQQTCNAVFHAAKVVLCCRIQSAEFTFRTNTKKKPAKCRL